MGGPSPWTWGPTLFRKCRKRDIDLGKRRLLAFLGLALMAGRLNVFVDQALQLIGRKDTRLPPAQLAVPEDGERRHAAYLVPCGDLWILVDIDFDDIGRIAYPLFQIVQYGGLHFAWSAP